MANKRIQLKHGTALVDENCSQQMIDALNKLSEDAYNNSKGYVFVVSERMHQKGIKCLTCNRTSYHPEDIKNLFCGFCNKFHDINF